MLKYEMVSRYCSIAVISYFEGNGTECRVELLPPLMSWRHSVPAGKLSGLVGKLPSPPVSWRQSVPAGELSGLVGKLPSPLVSWRQSGAPD